MEVGLVDVVCEVLWQVSGGGISYCGNQSRQAFFTVGEVRERIVLGEKGEGTSEK